MRLTRSPRRSRSSGRSETAAPDVLRAILHDLVEPTDEAVDQALDAATACFARHGVAHTSVPLLAKYLGVSRAKVYSQFGSVERLARLIIIRDVTRFIDTLPPECRSSGPAGVIATAVAAVRFGRDHSVITKVVTDEPAMIGELLPHAEVLLSISRRPLAQYLNAAMDQGVIRPGDPEVVADVLLRLVLTSVVLLPPGALSAYLQGVLDPLLTP